MTKRMHRKMQRRDHFCSRVQKEFPFFLHESCKSVTFALIKAPDIMPQLKTRQLLVDVARQLFAKNGFDSTTMNDIAESSGKGRRTLYTYFKNKEEVYSAVIDAELMRISSTFLAVARRQLPPLEKLVELIFAHLSLMKEAVERNGNLRSAFFRNIWKVGSVRKKYDKKEHDIIAKTLEEGRRAGVFDIDDLLFYTDIIQATAKGLEIPYIYGRLGIGMDINATRPIVTKILRRALGMREN
jgi:AcrR family transcriptional regulator